MLLAELSPLDIRQLFICHKEVFYRTYASWSEAKKEYVADFLHREYMVDKAGTREALFGHEAPLAEPGAAPTGPWNTGDVPDEPPAPPRVSERTIERDEEKGNYHLRERSWGKFSRSFSIPHTIDPDAVDASFERGVLTVKLPKAAEALARKIQIKGE